MPGCACHQVQGPESLLIWQVCQAGVGGQEGGQAARHALHRPPVYLANPVLSLAPGIELPNTWFTMTQPNVHQLQYLAFGPPNISSLGANILTYYFS